MTDAWKTGRMVLGVSLIVLAFFVPLGDRDSGTPIRITSSSNPSELARAFALDGAAGAVYVDSIAPDPTLGALLAGAAARQAPVRVTVPGQIPAIVVTPPTRPVAMRRAALNLALAGAPGADVPVTIEGPEGRVDSLSVQLDAQGRGHAAVAVEAASEGEATWFVRASGHTLPTTALVSPAAPVRVLMLTGAPGWEGRYLARALEAAGAVVGVHQTLGREQVVASAGAALPGDIADLEAWDVVALVDPPATTPTSLLHEWMREEGGGLLLLGSGAFGSALSPWSPAGPPREIPAAALTWSGPAEIVPLPSADVVSRAISAGAASRVPVAIDQNVTGAPTGPLTGSSVARSENVIVAADWVGRGRVFTSGLESWRWAMEAGLTTEHQVYWESVVEWLAGGLTDDVSLSGEPGAPNVAWEGRVEGIMPSTVALHRPGESSSIEGVVVSRVGASGRVRFVPREAGGHRFDDLREGAVIADVATPGPWTSAALTVGRRGGSIQHAANAAGPDGTPVRNPVTRLWLLFLTLGGVAVANWATRRAAGLA